MRILWLSLGMPKIPVAGALTHWPASARHSLGSPAFPRFVHGGADARGPTPCTHGVDDRRGARRPRRVEVGLPRWRAIYNSAREDAAPRRYPAAVRSLGLYDTHPAGQGAQRSGAGGVDT